MKTNAIVRIILFTIAILILAGILTVGLLGNLFMIRTDLDSLIPLASDEMTTYGGVKASDVQNIDIEWVAGSITIEPAENIDHISVQETVNDRYQMEMILDGNTLKIRYSQEDFKIIGFNSYNITGSKDLVITVPADWICNSLDIEAASSEVVVHDLTFNKVDFEGASGECSFTNCTVSQCDIETVSGNVCITGSVNIFSCEAVSADCRLELSNQPSSITVESISGDLELLLPADCGFSCSKDTVSGSFHTDFDCTSNGDVYVHGDGTCQIKVNAVSGDVQIQKNIESTTGKNCDH